MDAIRRALGIILLCSTSAIAAPASDQSIKQLFAVTQVQKMIEGMQSHMTSVIDDSVQQALRGQTPTAGEKKALENMKEGMLAIMRSELAWEKLEPTYLRLYRASFSEEEVVGMLEFYRTPAGQAVITKMPALVQQSLAEVQRTTAEMIPRMQKVKERFAAEMALERK
jgi:hypothetical protein